MTVNRAEIVLKWFEEQETNVPHLAGPSNSPDVNVNMTFSDMLKTGCKNNF